MSATSHFVTLPRDEERFRTYSLFEILPPDHQLIMDILNKSITEVVSTDSTIQFIEQQIFSDEEFILALELFAQYPDYCPLENLLYVKEGRTIEFQREQLYRALEDGWADALMRATRNTLSRCRQKLQLFNIAVVNMTSVGYMFLPYDKQLRNR